MYHSISAACALWTHILPAVSLQSPLYCLWLQIDTVAKNSVTEAQLWVLFVGQLVFLGWLLLLKKVQVRHHTSPAHNACMHASRSLRLTAPLHLHAHFMDCCQRQLLRSSMLPLPHLVGVHTAWDWRQLGSGTCQAAQRACSSWARLYRHSVHMAGCLSTSVHRSGACCTCPLRPVPCIDDDWGADQRQHPDRGRFHSPCHWPGLRDHQ